MKCANEPIGLLLADYYSGELTLQDQLRVESHVAQCDDCKRSLAVMTALGGQSPEPYTSDHLSPELISQYYQKQTEWPKDQAEHIRQHLDACDNCRREYEFLTGLESALEAAVSVPAKVVAKPSGWELVWKWFASPVPAWALALLLAYPAANWLMKGIQPDTQDMHTSVVGPVHKLAEARRGVDGTVKIERMSGEQILRFSVPMYTIPSDMKYRFEFVHSESDTHMETQVIANYQVTGEIMLLVDGLVLRDGSYVLTIVESDKVTQNIESERTYSFKLITQR
jgi:hypothetical protein